MEIKNNIIGSTFIQRSSLKKFQGKLKIDDPIRNKKLQNRILKSGFDAPIYLWHNHDNLILDGHQRLKALNELAHQGYLLEGDNIPVIYIVADNLIEAKEKLMEYNSRYSEFDMEELSAWISDLDMDDIDLGFEIQSADIPEEYDENIEDEVPEIVENPIVMMGDVFKLGNHVIMCGDTTKSEDVKILMGENKANMVWTDPPYNVDYKGHGKNTKNTIKNDKMGKSAFYNFLKDSFSTMKIHLIRNGGSYFRHNHKEQSTFEQALIDTGFDIKHQIVWNKPSMGLGGGDYRPKHELCFYCANQGTQNVFYGDRTHATVIDLWKEKTDDEILRLIKHARESESKGKTTVFSIKRDNVNEYVHPTQKPVELCSLSLLNNSQKGDIIFDGFLGSGVCVITAEKLGRRCYGMELDPRYVQVIIKRYWEVTKGTKPIQCINRKINLDEIIK